MKSVLISIQPKWCERIADGSKTIEVRKTKPKLETPFKVYIYCTKQKVNGEILLTHDKKVEGRNRGFRDTGDIPLAGKVIGEFVCDKIFPISVKYSNPNHHLANKEFPFTCLTDKQIMDYLGNGKDGYGWHISNLVIYDKPRELGEFFRECERPECEDCPHLCVENTPMYYEVWCPYDEKIPITRPPQSWCYVESLGDTQ